VDALTSFDDGSGPALYAGGNFTSAGGLPARNLARWNGTTWSTLGSGANGVVNALTVFDDGSGSGPALYATGSFTSVSGVAAHGIAKWNGSTWSALGSGLEGNYYGSGGLDVAAFDDHTGSGP